MADNKNKPIKTDEGEEKVFGNEPVKNKAETKSRDVVEVNRDDWQAILSRLGRLETEVGSSEALDLLKQGEKEMQVKVRFYSDPETGKDYLVAGFEPKRQPNGQEVTTWRMLGKDIIDGQTKMITYANIQLMDLENKNEVLVKNVDYNIFITMLFGKWVKVVKREQKSIDMTPALEYVEVGAFQERAGGYIKKVSSGQVVKTSVGGYSYSYVVDIDGKELELDGSAINFTGNN